MSRIYTLILLILSFTCCHSDEAFKLKDDQLKVLLNRVDHLVVKELKKNKLKLNPQVNDETFLRRTYIKIIGRIPTLEETKSFLDLRDKNKRKKLIDHLLTSKGYVHEMYIYWADILRTKGSLTGFQTESSGMPFVNWIKDQISKNVHYDDFVYNMLASTGDFWDKESGGIGVYAIDKSNPLDTMPNLVQVFLGTRLQCAQCHDHPFEKWTRLQFYEMAAFTNTQNWRGHKYKVSKYFKTETEKRNGSLMQLFIGRVIGSLLKYGFNDKGNGEIELPDDYTYDNGSPNQVVHAKTIFKERNDTGKNQENNSRGEFAKWMISKENPRFTKVIANRMWKKVMGVGLIEPVDDLKDNTVATNQNLMLYLEEMMKVLDYDLREFQRVLFNTKVYQRESVQRDYDDFSPYNFKGPLFQRMTGEQIWDSLSVMVNEKVDSVIYTREPMLYEIYNYYKNWTSEDIFNDILRFEKVIKDYGYDLDQRIDEQIIVNVILSELFPNKKHSKKIKLLLKAHANKGGYFGDFEYGSTNPQRPEVRSSEIHIGKGGAKLGHMIREFGGSSRETIQSQTRDAEITQPLFMMNDYLEKYLISNEDGDLNNNIRAIKNLTEKIEVAFLSILNRYPMKEESEMYMQYMRKHGEVEGGNVNVTDLIWYLVNSHEFLFVR